MPRETDIRPIPPDEEASFREHGYLLLKRVFSPDQVEHLLGVTRGLVAEATESDTVVRENYYHPASIKLAQVLRKTHAFDALIDHPGYFGRLVSLMGPYIQLMGSEIFVRGPAEERTITDFHTDLGPSLQRFLSIDDNPFLQIKLQIFLTDLSVPDSSNFTVIPGSHKRRVRDEDPLCMVHEINERVGADGELPKEALQILAEPGDVILFPHSLWHSVARNRSGRTRFSIALRYGQTALRPHDRFDFLLTDRQRTLSARQRRLLGDFGGHGSSPYRPDRQLEVIRGEHDGEAR